MAAFQDYTEMNKKRAYRLNNGEVRLWLLNFEGQAILSWCFWKDYAFALVCHEDVIYLFISMHNFSFYSSLWLVHTKLKLQPISFRLASWLASNQLRLVKCIWVTLVLHGPVHQFSKLETSRKLVWSKWVVIFIWCERAFTTNQESIPNGLHAFRMVREIHIFKVVQRRRNPVV